MPPVLFQTHGVVPYSIIISNLLHPSPEFLQIVFSKTKCFLEEHWVMLPQMCKKEMGQEYTGPIFLFQRRFGIQTWHLDLKRFRQHDVRAKLVYDLPMAIPSLCTPIAYLGQGHQLWMVSTILHGQVGYLSDHSG